jgi:hypothetical protein
MRFFSRLSTPEIGVDELDALIQSGSVCVVSKARSPSMVAPAPGSAQSDRS